MGQQADNPVDNKAQVETKLDRIIVLVWLASRSAPPDDAWVHALAQQLVLPPCSVGRVHADLDAVGSHRSDFDAALSEVADRYPKCAVLLLRAGLDLPGPRSALAQLVAQSALPASIVFTGNHSAHFNPFAEWPQDVAIAHPHRLVNFCGDGRWQPVEFPGQDCLLLPSQQATRGWAAIAREPAALVDHLFVQDPARPLRPDPDAIEDRDSCALPGSLRLRLRELADSGIEPINEISEIQPGMPVTLHISHDWGGGVWRWIEDFIAGDTDGLHLVLVAAGDRDGHCCGRRMRLHVRSTKHGRVRDWPLAPEIVSTSTEHSGYREILADTIERFGVGRIVVSSLIGHSLEALSTGLPTVQVLHDFYPAWPLLDFDPKRYAADGGEPDLNKALNEHGRSMRVRPRSVAFWRELRLAWQKQVAEHDVKLTAPTQHVIERWQLLNPETVLDIKRVPHAFQAFDDRRKARFPKSGQPLHLLIPGRLTRGKGLELLMAALPKLAGRVRLTALGCGRDGFALFGRSGIDLIPQYRRQDFPSLVRSLQPHAALFLSTVPETWNYALSEARAVGLAPVATRIGSFPERIVDGEDGLLFDPEPDALVAKILELAEDPEVLQDLATQKQTDMTPRKLVARFARIASPLMTEAHVLRALSSHELRGDRAAGRVAALASELSAVRDECLALEQRLDERTTWAQHLDRQFRQRSAWATSVQADLDAARAAHDQLQDDFEKRTAWSKSLEQDLETARSAYDQLQVEFEQRTVWSKSLEQDLEAARSAYDQLQVEFEQRTLWSKSLERELDAARISHRSVQLELGDRTEWAQKLDAELHETRRAHESLQQEFEQRSAWARSLAKEIEQARADLEAGSQVLAQRDAELQHSRQELQHSQQELQHSQQELQHSQQELQQRQQQLEDVSGQRDQLQYEFDRITQSRSWRLTRPLRVSGRLARNARARGIANPLRWPHLLRRLVHHLRLRGVRRSLELFQAAPAAGQDVIATAGQPAPSETDVADPVTMSPPRSPEVSVIVPVFNQLHYTAACLQSLVAVQTNVSFEVIVVDDASSDDTRSWLRRCTGVRAIRNRRNRGFIGSCNRGAKAARGRWLVFLNNDTRVDDGWLDALIDTFTRYPDTGIAGGRLIFADGTLQEAGGILFRDGSAWNYGRGDHPDKPGYGFVSEADYVSGACLAIERERFASLDGFDRYFSPAYYEDTDLCMRIREQGLKVRYQPAATVIHYEGVTSGTDEAAGVKQHQVTNCQRFFERWQETLTAYPENPQQYTPKLARQLRQRRFPRRALVIDATTPMPDHDSGSVRMVALLELLGTLGFQTAFLPENRLWTGRHSSDLQQAGIEVLVAPWVQDPEVWLEENGADLDLIIVSRHYVLSPMLKMLRAMCPNAKLVFDTVDLHFLREQREAELSGSGAALQTAARTRKQELALVEAADATLVVSEFERELLSRIAPDAQVEVVSNIHSLRDPGKPFEQRRDLVFVGGFQHPPNLDAARWLMDEIMPKVRESLPEVRLHMIGSRMPEDLLHRRAPGVVVHGFVADLEPYMTGCRISVAPLRYGAGVKGKVNQAMSHGLPVVATSCAAEGMYTEDGHDILMTDETEGFAAAIVRLYQDEALWRRLAENSRSNVQRHFSTDAARAALLELLVGLGMDTSEPLSGGDEPS